jgi:hypothetical protein
VLCAININIEVVWALGVLTAEYALISNLKNTSGRHVNRALPEISTYFNVFALLKPPSYSSRSDRTRWPGGLATPSADQLNNRVLGLCIGPASNIDERKSFGGKSERVVS